MILRVFGLIVRTNRNTLNHFRCGGPIERTLFSGFKFNAFSARHSLPRIYCRTDYATIPDRRRNNSFLLHTPLPLKSTIISFELSNCGNIDTVVRAFHKTVAVVSKQSVDDKSSSAKNCKGVPDQDCLETPEEKKSLFQNFKQMYRDYWYVLVPVHVVTSLAWFGGFYYLVKSGVDVAALIEKIGLGEKLAEHLRDSKAGYLAMSFALYKLATPLRYMVTIGGTTFSIKWLRDFGYIKPLKPQDIKEMYQEQRKCMKEKRRRKKELKEKRSN